jgi:DNA-binding LacI/PurR family transcriptional regulator
MVTIGDVARAAGVSTSTVSYALSGRRPISPETRARVKDAIARLGYHPHAGARALASSRSSVLALVAPLRADINVPVIMQFVAAVVTAARAHNHDVLLLTKDEGTAGLERVAGSAMVDALIVMDIESDDARLPALRRLRQPSVLIGLPARPAGLTCVDLDFGATGRACVEHLAGHGHRRIGLVGPAPGVYLRGTGYAARFLTGYTEAAADLGLHAVAQPCEPTFDGVQDCLDRITGALAGVSALVVHNEAALVPLLDRLRAAGRRVPWDVSVVAVCPREVSFALPLRLTTAEIPAQEVGTMAVELAMRHLDPEGGRRGGRRPEPECRLLPPAIVEGDSCARFDGRDGT